MLDLVYVYSDITPYKAYGYSICPVPRFTKKS